MTEWLHAQLWLYVQNYVALNKVCFCGSFIETASIQDCTESVLEYNKNEDSSHV